MAKEAAFTLKLEVELRDEFMADDNEARDYGNLLRLKVEAGRASIQAGMGTQRLKQPSLFASLGAPMFVKVIWTPEAQNVRKVMAMEFRRR